jgi:hypothetical protein
VVGRANAGVQTPYPGAEPLAQLGIAVTSVNGNRFVIGMGSMAWNG